VEPVTGMTAGLRSRSVPRYDAVVVGAGPYGLSTAAHLLGRGLRVGVFGKTLELWRDHMPKGMMLRSHCWASNLSDPHRQYGFDRFCRESGRDTCYPVSLDAFVQYGLWFQRHAVPDVEELYVSSIERRGALFQLTLEDGRTVASAAVVLAAGPASYAHRPEQYRHLPPGLVSHSCDHNDLARFSGKQVLVIGGAQSAIEHAALLHEAGATVHVVSRRPIAWRDRDRTFERSIVERIMAPTASMAPGWPFWALDHFPYAFYRLPQVHKDSYNSNYSSGAADWLRNRVLGSVALHEGRTVAGIEAIGGKAHARLSDGKNVTADHVLLATGYKVDAGKLSMIHPSLLADIRTDTAVPLLNHSFESTVPGLYFVGLTSLRAFGPLYRFVAGCASASRRVARDIARKGTATC
jgi:lysine/ornithine N-monooxygenase